MKNTSLSVKKLLERELEENDSPMTIDQTLDLTFIIIFVGVLGAGIAYMGSLL